MDLKRLTLPFLMLGLLWQPLSAMVGGVGVETRQQINTGASNPRGATNWINLAFSSDFIKNRFDTFVDFSARLYFFESDFVVSVPEAYLVLQNANESLAFGRKKLHWTMAEELWDLSDLHGQQGLSLLGDGQEGLIGAHWDYSWHPRWTFSLFASPLFVPELNPRFKVENGKVSSLAYWAKIPPNSMEIEGKRLPVAYNLNRPETSEVLLRPSLGLRLMHRWRKGDISFFTIYKPENKLRIDATGRLNESLDRVSVDLYPKVNHHLMSGIDWRQELMPALKLVSGLKVVDPNGTLKLPVIGRDQAMVESARKELSSRYATISPSYQRHSYAHSDLIYTWKFWQWRVGGFWELSDVNFADPTGTTVKWQRAVAIGSAYEVNDALKLQMDYKVDVATRAHVVVSKVEYQIDRNWLLAVGTDLIAASNKRDSYWKDYSTFDTAYSTFSYHF